MKKVLLAVLLVACTQLLLAFEPSALNLKVPSNLERNSLVFDIQHRFYGDLTEDPLENFFGLDIGANVNLGIRYAILERLELYAAYTRFEKEYRVAASYAYHFPQTYVRTQISLEYFSLKIGQERHQNLFYGLDGSNRKSLILIWRYMFKCLQCSLHFICNKTHSLKTLNYYSVRNSGSYVIENIYLISNNLILFKIRKKVFLKGIHLVVNLICHLKASTIYIHSNASNC